MDTRELLDIATSFKSGLLAKATDGTYSNIDFKNDLENLLSDKHIEKMLPSLIRRSRTADDFRRAMQAKFDHYAERRQYINDELEPIFDYLEGLLNGTDTFCTNLSDYNLGESLGRGGYGTVHKFHHELLDLDFAVKIFDPVFVSNEENLEGEKRFFREAKVLFNLNHKNIVRVFDIGRISGKPFIRMEYVEGYTLQDFVDTFGIVNFTRSLKPITALLEGLSYAHKLGVVHRDLKPTNFMVTKDGKFKIIDFGISAFIDCENHTKLTKTGESVIGGPFSDPVLLVTPKLRDVRSDIYSVGAIWYYLLVGIAPAGGDVREKLMQSGNLTALQAEIVLKCIASNIEDRFSSCDELLSIIRPEAPALKDATSMQIRSNQITEVTRDEIVQYLIDLYNEEMNAFVYSQSPAFQQPECVFRYYGRKNEISFLKRIYDFDKISSSDGSFENELTQHTIRNDDYPYEWVFFDERLQLQTGEDEVLLKFLCEMFHPLIRSEKSSWNDVLNHLNSLLNVDGYEIYESGQISNKSIYSYRFHI